MEFVFLVGIVAGVVWLSWKLFHTAAGRHTQAAFQNAVARRLAQQQARRWKQLQRLNTRARALQIALLQLARAPDFRRAASFAAQAQGVPASFRQRQYRRFRPLLLRHFAARLRAGADADVLLQSLRELLGHLSIPAYEADYIRNEAEAALARPAVPQHPPTYAHRLAQLQREHEQRVQALRGLRAVDADTREQLLEAEENRFRQALQELGTEQSSVAAP